MASCTGRDRGLTVSQGLFSIRLYEGWDAPDFLERTEEFNESNTSIKNYLCGPQLVWLSGLSTNLKTKGSPVRFPDRAHAWVAGQVPSGGYARNNHTLMFLSLSSPSLPL